MRTISVAVTVLLVVLAGSGIAGASTITFRVQVDDLTLSLDDADGVPTSTAYRVYAEVTNNSYVCATGKLIGPLPYEPRLPWTFYGGIAQVEANLNFTSTGTTPTGKVTAGWSNVVDEEETGDPTKAYTPFNTGTGITNNFLVDSGNSMGSIVNGSGVITAGGTGGIGGDNISAFPIFGAMPVVTGNSAYRPTSLSTSTMTDARKKFYYGNTAGDYIGYASTAGGPGGILVFSGTLEAVTAGTVHIDILPTNNTIAWSLDSGDNLSLLQASQLVGTDFDLTIVPEPATMGLLAFGVVALLKRRRRA